ncbi:hypothetical protein M0208_06660 [Sphingomonas sp. SUN019]|nr:hypothetical protein [Sphingomonas sp. SUN019]UVO50218.1 hypothetical protein M0208_06660 [Sphingomonas sp. SUN019]
MFLGRIARSYEEAFGGDVTRVPCAHEHMRGRSIDVDPAHGRIVVFGKTDADWRGAISLSEMIRDQVRQVQLHLVAIAAKAVIVTLQPGDRAIVRNADQQRSADTVGEPGQRLDRDVLQLLVLDTRSNIPPQRFLEFEPFVFALGDQRRQWRWRFDRRCGDRGLAPVTSTPFLRSIQPFSIDAVTMSPISLRNWLLVALNPIAREGAVSLMRTALPMMHVGLWGQGASSR